MLQQGAGRRGALEIADEAAFLGAQLNTAASYDAATVSLHVPRRRLEPALDLLADVVLRPTFADSEVVRQRELRRAQIVQLADNPVAIAGIAFPAIVYGRSHPYGRPLNGTEASTASLRRDRVAEFYGAAYRPNAARILVTGDVTLAEVRRVLAVLGGAAGGPVRGQRVGRDRQDRQRANRVPEGAAAHPGRARARPRARQGEGVHHARPAGGLRDDGRRGGAVPGAARVRLAARLLRALRRAHQRRDGRRRAARRAAAYRPRALRHRRCGGQEPDRSGDQGLERGPHRVPGPVGAGGEVAGEDA